MNQTCPCPSGQPGVWGKRRNEISVCGGLPCASGQGSGRACPAEVCKPWSHPGIWKLQGAELCMQTPESALHGPHAQVPPGPGQEAKCRKEVGYGTVLAGEHVPQPVVASGDECPVSA